MKNAFARDSECVGDYIPRKKDALKHVYGWSLFKQRDVRVVTCLLKHFSV